MESRCSCLAFGILLFAGCSQTFPVQDRAQLAAYIAYEIVSKEGPVPDTPPPDSDVCPECNGTGEVGDGTVMFPCSFCGGTGRVASGMQKKKPEAQQEAKPLTTLELADHLRRVHGANINGKTREQLEAMHNRLHNPQACPNGRCPTK